MGTGKKGLLIAIEGIDGAGSTTQARLLADYLSSKGKTTHLTAEPSKGPIGQLLRAFLRNGYGEFKHSEQTLALLFAADRMHHLASEIEERLLKNEHVVTDRYALSSLVYQGAELPTSWVSEINKYAKKPDLTILIDVRAEVAEERRNSRGGSKEIFDDLKTQLRIRERYLKLLPKDHSLLIDGNDTSDVVFKRVRIAVDDWLSRGLS